MNFNGLTGSFALLKRAENAGDIVPFFEPAPSSPSSILLIARSRARGVLLSPPSPSSFAVIVPYAG